MNRFLLLCMAFFSIAAKAETSQTDYFVSKARNYLMESKNSLESAERYNEILKDLNSDLRISAYQIIAPSMVPGLLPIKFLQAARLGVVSKFRPLINKIEYGANQVKAGYLVMGMTDVALAATAATIFNTLDDISGSSPEKLAILERKLELSDIAKLNPDEKARLLSEIDKDLEILRNVSINFSIIDRITMSAKPIENMVVVSNQRYLLNQLGYLITTTEIIEYK